MLTALRLQGFTVFAKEDFRFGAINVIHGENGSGITHLLKLAYSIVSSLVVAANEIVAERPTKVFMDARFASKLVGVFRPDRGKLGRLVRRTQGHKRAEVLADFGPAGCASFSFSTQSDKAVRTDDLPSAWLTQGPVFLPTRELLSVYPGFVSLYETQAIPFDEIWRDTCVLLGSPVARGANNGRSPIFWCHWRNLWGARHCWKVIASSFKWLSPASRWRPIWSLRGIESSPWWPG